MGWSNSADDPIRIQHNFEGLFTFPSLVCFAAYHSTTDQSLPDHVPRVSTLRALFTRHLDINSVPKRSFFHVLKDFATDEREREKLEEFCSPQGAVSFTSIWDCPLLTDE